MKIVMTLMVRDEADIVGAMLEHHRAQGVDHIVVTDNGSIDGTAEILQKYEDAGFATVWHDPIHRKQQYTTVTKMARYAATDLDADWVINADADEFWVPTGDGTLRDALSAVDESVPYLTVRVVNLTGAPAKDGSGLARLVYRDERSDEELHAVGIPFPPTADAVHRGHAQVEVAQGNHFVNAPGWGEGQISAAIEVMHLPWRSWRQYEHKVRIAGEAYLSNPDLTPSPRHHGMQDFRRWQAGRLEQVYVAKHPTGSEIEALVATGSLVPYSGLVSLSTAKIDGVRADVPYSAADAQTLAETGRLLAALEAATDLRHMQLREELDAMRSERDEVTHRLRAVEEERDDLERERDSLVAALEAERGRFVVRATDRAAAAARSVLHPGRTSTASNNSGSDR